MSDADFLPMSAPFALVRKGYEPAQVEEHLGRVDAELRITAADRDAAASQSADLASQLDAARAEIEALHATVARISAGPSDTEGLSDRMQRMMRLAQDEASEIRARAEADAAEIRSVAEQETAVARTELTSARAALAQHTIEARDDAERRRTEMEAEHAATMGRASRLAQEVTDTAAADRGRRDAESARQRAAVEEDFELAMTARRTEALQALQQGETTSKAEAERRVRDATTEAQRRLQRATQQSEQKVAEADARVRELTALRGRVGDQLASVRALLDTVPATLVADPEEAPTPARTDDTGAAVTTSDA